MTAPADSRPLDLAHSRGLVMLVDVDIGYPDATRTHSIEVAKGFARAGLDVDLVARGEEPGLPGVRYARAAGAEHEKLVRLLSINARAIDLLWRRRRSAKRFYVRDNWSCFPAIVVGRLLGYRVVVQVDGIPYGKADAETSRAFGVIKRALATVVGRMSCRQLAVTPEIKRLLVELTRVAEDRVEVIPNGVDLDFFSPIPREEAIARLGLDPATRYLVFCGGLHPWTDFDGLLEAFSEVHAERADTSLVLVGDGPQRDHIESRARDIGVRESITITGMIEERERVRDYLAAAAVTLLAYRADKVETTSASPIKLTEYLAMGRGVVAVEISGLRELLGDSGAGVLVDGEASEMAPAILGLLSDGQADAYGAAGRAVAEAKLSWEIVIERTLALFGDC